MQQSKAPDTEGLLTGVLNPSHLQINPSMHVIHRGGGFVNYNLILIAEHGEVRIFVRDILLVLFLAY